MQNDNVALTLFSSDDFERRELAESFLEILNRQRLDFLPEKFDIYAPAKQYVYNKLNSTEAVDLWLNSEHNKKSLSALMPGKSGSIILQRGKKEDVTYSITWKKNRNKNPKMNSIDFSITSSFLHDRELFNDFHVLCEELILLFNSVKARIHNNTQGLQAIRLDIIHPELSH